MAGSTELSLLLKAINKASGPIGEVGSSLDTLHGKAGKAQTALGPLNNLLGTGLKAAAGLAVGGLVALGGAIGVSVTAAANFEQGLADISAAMGANSAETAKLKTLITNLGFDPKLKVSATEAAQAIGALGTAGVSVKDILNGAAKSTILLANATGADMADAASIATDVMAQFGIEVKDLNKAVNGITSTTIASKFNIQDYRLALAQAGGVAATVGVSFDDFNTTIAAISPSFASGSDAGTSFKTFLQTLIPKSKDAEGTMRKLGLITADGANQFFTASGKMKSMGEISGILNKALGGLTDQQKNEALATIFGTDAMRAAAAMSGFTQEKFNKLQAEMAKTDATVQAAKRMNTLKGAMEIMWGVVDTLKLQIGEKFLPVVRRMAEMFTEQAQKHGPAIINMFAQLADKATVALAKFLPWVEKNLPLFIAQVPVAVGHLTRFVGEFVKVTTTVVNAVAPVVKFIAQLVGLKGILIAVGGLMAVSAVASIVTFIGGIVSAVGAVGSFVGALGVAVPALGAVLAAIGPVILIVGAIAAAVAALYLAWKNNFLGIRDITKNIFAFVKGIFTDFPATVGWVKEWFKTWGSAAVANLRSGLSAVVGHFTWLGKVFTDFPGTLKWVKDWFQTWGAAAMTNLRAGLNAVTEHLPWLRGVITNFPSTIEGVKDKFRLWAQGAMAKMREGLVAAKDSVRSGLTVVMDWLKAGADERLPGWQQTLYDGGRLAIRRFNQGMNSLKEIAKQQLGQILKDTEEHGAAYAAGAFAGRMYSSAVNVVSKFLEGFNATAPDLKTSMSNALNGMTGTFNGIMDALRNHVYAVAQGLMARIKEGIAAVNVAEAIGNALNSLTGTFNGMMDGLRNHVFYSAQGLINRIREGIGSISIGEAINNALNGLIGTFNSVMDGLRNHVFYAAQGMVNRIREGIAIINVGEAIQNVLNGLTGTFNSVMDGLRNHVFYSAQGLVNRIREGIGSVNVGEAMQGALNGLTGTFNSLMDGLRNHVFYAAQAMVSKIREGIASVDISGTMTAALNGLTGAFNSLMDALRNHAFYAAQAMVGKIGEGIGSVDVGGAMTGVLNGLTGALNGLMDALRNHAFYSAQAVVGKIREGLASIDLGGGMASALGSITNAFNSAVSGMRDSMWGAMKGVGERIIDGLRAGIDAARQRAIDALSAVTNALPAWMRTQLGIHSDSTVFTDIGRDMIGGLIRGMRSLAAEPQRMLDNLGANLSANMAGVAASVPSTSNVSNSRTTNNYFTLPGALNPDSSEANQQIALLNTLTSIYAH